MSQPKPVLFNAALEAARVVAGTMGQALGAEPILVRDLNGRIRVLLPKEADAYDPSLLEDFRQQLSQALGPYGYPAVSCILHQPELPGIERHLSLENLLFPQSPNEDQPLGVPLLDRQIVGQDWKPSDLTEDTPSAKRVTFFGIKGGVGRSTALVLWAWHLARQGKKVLVFDLDLESPGVSSLLLPQDHLPDYGIVDWFVEDGVGQADLIESEMYARSPLSVSLAGEIRVVPAYGLKTEHYLPKLARCYADTGSGTAASWSERLKRLVAKQEEQARPDVTFLDSRAGLHDIAAALITRVQADTLLFAVDSDQTWQAYTFLFQYWREYFPRERLQEFRQRLQIVAGMIPETQREQHLQRFRERAWDLFREHLYDAVPHEESAATDTFSFDLHDEAAPHYPWPVFWNRALMEFAPGDQGAAFSEQTAAEALGIFMEKAGAWIISEGEPT